MDIGIRRHQVNICSSGSTRASCAYSLIHWREFPLQASDGTYSVVTKTLLARCLGIFRCKTEYFLLAKNNCLGWTSVTRYYGVTSVPWLMREQEQYTLWYNNYSNLSYPRQVKLAIPVPSRHRKVPHKTGGYSYEIFCSTAQEGQLEILLQTLVFRFWCRLRLRQLPWKNYYDVLSTCSQYRTALQLACLLATPDT